MPSEERVLGQLACPVLTEKPSMVRGSCVRACACTCAPGCAELQSLPEREPDLEVPVSPSLLPFHT